MQRLQTLYLICFPKWLNLAWFQHLTAASVAEALSNTRTF